MDGLRLLAQLGDVEPVDEHVLEAAVASVAAAADTGQWRALTSRPPAARRRPLLAPAAVAVALTAAAAVTAAALAGHPAARSRPPAAIGGARVTTPSPAPSAGADSPAMAAILTAFSAGRDDILEVTKVVRGEGSCCKSVIVIAPAEAAAGAEVRSRVQNFTLAGSPLDDMTLSYRAPAAAVGAQTSCAGIFGRPRVANSPATGLPGTATIVDPLARRWSGGAVRIGPVTVPTAAGLTACLRDGRWRELRRGAGGRSIELVTSDGSGRMWVSAATFLPARLTETTPTRYGPTVISFTFRFLPPTAANEAKLALRVPPGFIRTPIPG
jgi:hypothetical protein